MVEITLFFIIVLLVGYIIYQRNEMARIEKDATKYNQDALELLYNIKMGGALVKIEVLDKDSVFLRSPRMKR